MTPEIIVRADIPGEYGARKLLAEQALEAGYTSVLLRRGDEKIAEIGRFCALFRDGEEISGGRCGAFIRIESNADLQKAYAADVPLLIIEPADWKVIPLENLISRFQNKAVKIFVAAESRSDAELALQTMECGCDGVCIPGERLSEFAGILDGQFPDIGLSEAEITKITPLGLGDRVCIDTCSLMQPGDAMLIGSSSSALFCVCSESFACEYVNERPFRVNAGAVHSYILTPDETTRYLSEISAGSPVLVRKADGSPARVFTGRVKCEVRPLLLIEAEYRGVSCSVILQNAETVRLLTPSGAQSVSSLKPGDAVYVRFEEGGRHFGHKMTETILEK